MGLWLALIAALLVGLVAGAVTIAIAASFHEGDLVRRVRREIAHTHLFYLPGALLGASTAVPYLVEPCLAVVFALPASLVWLVLRSHGALMHRLVEASVGKPELIAAMPSRAGDDRCPDDWAAGDIVQLRAGSSHPLAAALRTVGVVDAVAVALGEQNDVTGVVVLAATDKAIAVAVSISSQSLLSAAFPRVIAKALRQADVPARLLTLEITERAMIGDSPRTVETLEQLARLGVRLSVDDFGTGYSSMVHLQHLPIAELKIGHSFITEMLVGGSDEVIVSSTVALGHNLGMSVVAEGVEKSEVEALLRSASCDIAQGYGIAPPMDVDSIDRFLRTAKSHPPLGHRGSQVARPSSAESVIRPA